MKKLILLALVAILVTAATAATAADLKANCPAWLSVSAPGADTSWADATSGGHRYRASYVDQLSKYFQQKYGSISNSALNSFGLSRQVGYEPIITAYNNAEARMDADNIRGIISIIGSTYAAGSGNPADVAPLANLFVVEKLNGGRASLPTVVDFELVHADRVATPAYKAMWKALLSGDSDAFLRVTHEAGVSAGSRETTRMCK